MMYLTISTPVKNFFEGDVQQVTFPGSKGLFQVLENHAPLVSLLQKGTIVYENNGEKYRLVVEYGWVEVRDNHITVLLPSVPQGA